MLHELDEAQSDMTKEKVSLAGPGIMVLSSLLQPLHMNRRAVTLLSELASATTESQQPMSRTGALPPPLVDLAGKILSVLRRRAESAENRQCEICYLADNPRKQMVIRCIGLPNGHGLEDARIVFVMTETNNQARISSIPVPAS